jgi:hypothetical protein
MKIFRYFILFAFIVLSFPAYAMDGGHTCEHHENTIEHLQMCVAHHVDQGGILRGLQAKLNAAQNADDRGQPHVAVNNLEAFINLVEAQAGKHIAVEHADHMIQHANAVITMLSSS